ncbi:phosphotransferase [Lentzea sp. NPDC060358]|uniref:phosphotransferase n=1 Tax=Lentzea sp. NPDC060358 TaxID=3347103 RepID=UPI00364CBE3D
MIESPAPVLEMLWESHEPRAALGLRFGLPDEEAAARWVARALHDHWGVRVLSCERIVISDHNALAWVGTESGRLVAKWSVAPERFAHLAQVARLTRWLDGCGLPVSAPVPALDGRLQVELDGASLGLQHEVDAGLLDTGDPGEVRAAGAVLARLQDALAEYPEAGRIAAGPPRPPADRITGWLGSEAGHLPAAARDALRGLVAAAPPGPLPVQLVHRDFRSANVLCARGEVVAVLDFEEVAPDHRVVELARSATLLGTRFRDWGPVPPGVCSALLAGYRSVRPLTAAEEGWWDALLLWHALAMVPPGDDPTGWGAAAAGLIGVAGLPRR